MSEGEAQQRRKMWGRAAGLIAAASSSSSRVGARRSMSGHWLHKNVRYEENAGLREASYKTWEFDASSLPRLTAYMFLPGLLFYVLAVEENKVKDEQIGKKTNGYGVMPLAAEAVKKE